MPPSTSPSPKRTNHKNNKTNGIGNKKNSNKIDFDPVVYFPVVLGLATLAIGCLYDPNGAFEPAGSYKNFNDDDKKKAIVFPLPLNISLVPNLLFSPYVIVLWSCIGYGLKLMRETTKKYHLNRREQFAMTWSLMNACWFHTGCDVFSGLFQFMPNFTETYKVLNKDHILPMHHPERVVMDCIYWFELLVETPLALVVFYLFLTRYKSRWIVEAWLHGMHLGGYVGYYIPDMVLHVHTHPLISNLDRTIAFTWVVIPAILTWDAVQRSTTDGSSNKDE
jgi:hypothetical protein